MRINAKGQVTIPRDIRERAGLAPGTEIDFEIENGEVRLFRAGRTSGAKTRGQMIVERLRGAGNFKTSTDEIIALMRGPPAEV